MNEWRLCRNPECAEEFGELPIEEFRAYAGCRSGLCKACGDARYPRRQARCQHCDKLIRSARAKRPICRACRANPPSLIPSFE